MKGVFLFTFFSLMSLLLGKHLSEELSRATFKVKAKLANEKGKFVQRIEKQRQLESAQPPMLVYVPVASCHQFLSQDFGEFFPPAHSDNSLANIWCNWTIWAGPRKHIVVYIKNFIANEDCDKNEDKIVFEGVSSPVENTVVYACWNKITHMFAAQALAVHVVFLSSGSSRKHAGKYFRGSYFVFKDHETDVSIQHPVLSSIVLAAPVREVRYSIDAKASTKIPLLSSITDAVKLKEIDHSDKTSIVMQKSSFTFLSSSTPITETIYSSDDTTTADQITLPSLTTPVSIQEIDRIGDPTAYIKQYLRSSVAATKKLRDTNYFTEPKVNYMPSSPSFVAVPTPVKLHDYKKDPKTSMQQFLHSTVTATISVRETNDLADPRDFTEQDLLSSEVVLTPVKEIGYVSDTKTYIPQLWLSSETASASLSEMDYISGMKPPNSQTLLSSVVVPTSIIGMSSISDPTNHAAQPLLPYLIASISLRDMDYIRDSKAYAGQPLLSSITVAIQLGKMNAFADSETFTEQYLHSAIVPTPVKEMAYNSNAATYTPLNLLSSTAVKQIDYNHDTTSYTWHPLLSLVGASASIWEMDYINDLKSSIEQLLLYSLVAPITVTEMDYVREMSTYIPQSLLAPVTASTYIREISYTSDYETSLQQPLLFTFGSETDCSSDAKFCTLQPLLSSASIPIFLGEINFFTASKASIEGMDYIGDIKLPTQQTLLSSIAVSTSLKKMDANSCTNVSCQLQLPSTVDLTGLGQACTEKLNPTSLTDPTLLKEMNDISILKQLTQQHFLSATDVFTLVRKINITDSKAATEPPWLASMAVPMAEKEIDPVSEIKSSIQQPLLFSFAHLSAGGTNHITDPSSFTEQPLHPSIDFSSVIREKTCNIKTSSSEIPTTEIESTHDYVAITTTSSIASPACNYTSTGNEGNESCQVNLHRTSQADLEQIIKETFMTIDGHNNWDTSLFQLQKSISSLEKGPEEKYFKTKTDFLRLIGLNEDQESEPTDLRLVSTAAPEYLYPDSLTLQSSRLKAVKMELRLATVAPNSGLKTELTSRVSVSYYENIIDTDLQQILPSRTLYTQLGSLQAETDQQQMLQEEKIHVLNISKIYGLQNLFANSAHQTKPFQDRQKQSQLASEDLTAMAYSDYISKFHIINETSSKMAPLLTAWLNYQKMKVYGREFAFQKNYRNLNEDVTPPLKEVNEIQTYIVAVTHLNDKPHSQILSTSTLISNLETTSIWHILPADFGFLVTHRARTPHVYSFSDDMSQQITPLEMGDDQEDFVAVHTHLENGTTLEGIHSPGDVLFEINEKLFFLSRQDDEIKLMQTERTESRNMIKVWIQLKPEIRNASYLVKSQLDMLTNSSLGNRTTTLVSLSIEDVNECELALYMCDKHATCQNEFGTYSCHCKRGYEDRSPAASGTVCVWQSGSGFLFSYLEILIVVPLCTILLLLTIVVILYGIAQKKQAKKVLSLERRASPTEDPAEISKKTTRSLAYMSSSEPLTHGSFPRAQLATVEEHASETESDNRKVTISVEQTAC
ncbi:uncharacterized protein LOC115087033 isoform X3 [Rhinatrema bivittatum]|uniref:uncharacterized protein LOC115087033 isoform X3 n=1 Tax=Rhinatrema bivittatum TaxID=194408 RepID=UPI001128D7CF|nr:uncharacterized protein LOC115087033 isoform X3 [Rhinatrema bivittatum]